MVRRIFLVMEKIVGPPTIVRKGHKEAVLNAVRRSEE
jgi:hypothetical protein